MKLQFYCKGCAKDYTYEQYYKHKCKINFPEKMANISVVFRCKNCNSAFATPEPRDDHESWCHGSL